VRNVSPVEWHWARTFVEAAYLAPNVLLLLGPPWLPDEAYIGESILQAQGENCGRVPASDADVPGPHYGRADLNLTAYIKSLQSQPAPAKDAGIAPASAGRN